MIGLRRRRILFLSVFFLSVVITLYSPEPLWICADPHPDETQDVGWPMFRQNPTHTGYAVTKAPNSNYTRWIYETGGDIESSPVVVDNIAFFGSEDQHLYAINIRNGSLLWGSRTGGHVESTPTVGEGKVFVGSEDGTLHAYNVSTGNGIWNFSAGGDVYSSPTVVGGRIFFGSANGRVYALNSSNGSLLWSYNTGERIYSSPAVVGGRVFIGSFDGRMYSFDSVSGGVLWTYQTGGVVFSSPAIDQGSVFFGSEDGYVYGLDASSGMLMWRYKTAGAVYSSPAIYGGVVYVGSSDSNLYALNGTNGSLVWSYKTGGPVNSPPSIADHKVFFGSADGKVYALRRSNGVKLWSYQTGGEVRSSPAIADGVLIVGSRDHKVYCFSEDEWPMFRHDISHLGLSTNPAPSTNRTLWKSVMGDRILSSPIVSGGMVFVGSDDHKVHAFDLTNGKRLWDTEVGGDVRSTPTAYGGMVFVGSEDGRLYALNASTGSLIWNFMTNGKIEASPTVHNRRIYFGSRDNKTYCVDALSGSLVWNYTTRGPVNSTVAISSDFVYVGSDDGNIYALNATSGVRVWNYSTRTSVYSSPAVSEGMVFIGLTNNSIFALRASDGRLIWKNTTGGPIFSSPAVSSGNVYLGSDDGYVYSIRARDGRLNWKTRTNGKVRSSPAIADGKVFIGSHDGRIYALDAWRGTVLWSYKTEWYVTSSPSIAKGMVLVGSWDQRLYAFSDIPLIIDSSTTLPIRSPINSVQRIGSHAIWSRDGSNVVGGTIYVNNRPYKTNGSGWITILNSSARVCKNTWNVTGIEADGETSFRQNVVNLTTIWDGVDITLSSPKSRINLWENGTISWYGMYRYDKSPFIGRVTLNTSLITDNKVGRRTYSVASITDNLYNLTSFTSNAISIVWDRIVISLNISDGRIDVGDNASISWSGWYEYDNRSFEGGVTLNDTTTKSRVGRYSYTVKNISDSAFGIRSFRSNAVVIIFDKVTITLQTPSQRVDVRSNLTIHWSGRYEYDNSTFSGTIRLNTNETSYDSPRNLTYYVTEIIDWKYGLRSFSSNEVTGGWDRVKITDGGSVNTTNEVGRTETIWFKAVYESDNLRFDASSGSLYVNGSAMSWSPNRTRWEYNYTSDVTGDRYFTISGVRDTRFGLTTFTRDKVVRSTWSKAKMSIQWVPISTLIERGERITITGRISPPVARNLTVIYTDPRGSEVSRTIATGSEGSFTDVFEPTLEGAWTVKASWPGNYKYEGIQAITAFQVRRTGLIPFLPLSLNEILLIGLVLFLTVMLVSRRKRIRMKNLKASKAVALAATALTLITLFLPIYSMDLRFSMRGFGDLYYGIEFSMLTGAKTSSSLKLAQSLPLDVTAFQRKTGDSAPLEALLRESDLPDVKRMAREAGVPFDVTALPIDVSGMTATADLRVSEIPLLSSKASIDSLLSKIPLASNFLPLLLQYGPLIIFIPPLIGLARGRYGKTALTFLSLVFLPIIISIFLASITVTVRLGGYLLIVASALLFLAAVMERIASRSQGSVNKEGKSVTARGRTTISK